MSTRTERAAKVAEKYSTITSERQHDQNFIRDLVGIFTDEDPSSVFRWQRPVKTKRGTTGAIDALWAGHILFEIKSAGKNLEDTLNGQVRDYIAYLPGRDRPQLTIISDFQYFLIEDPDGKEHFFPLAELPRHLGVLSPIFDGLPSYLRHNGTVNAQAAILLGNVIRGLREAGYPEADMPTMATRLLFCLYADDNLVWTPETFHSDVEGSRADGSDLGRKIAGTFLLLDSPGTDATSGYRYINGGLFSDRIAVARFDAATREALLEACRYDWTGLDPMIFGTIYQDAMNEKARHAEGAHYTHEEDILDILGPAFLNDLKARRAKAVGDKRKLTEFLNSLTKVQVLDPACGSGNFLMVAYREVRRLETDAIIERKKLGVKDAPVSRVELSQFHGLEYNRLSAAIAQTSMWLALHAADMEHTGKVGEFTFETFPLADAADIRHANAVTTDWVKEFPNLTAIVGNPPYISNNAQNAEQRGELRSMGIRGGKMDYAHIWMVKAAGYIAANPDTRSGYVITDSVAQGTQATGLWSHPAMVGVYPIFGRQSYVWPGDAQVRVVNYGLGCKPEALELMSEEGSFVATPYLTPYLTPASVPTQGTAIKQRGAPSWLVPIKRGVVYGDFGHYSKLGHDLAVIQRDHPEMLVNKISAVNLLSGKADPVLWFGNRSPKAVTHKAIAPRREAVRLARLAAKDREVSSRGPEWLPTSIESGALMGVPKLLSKRYAVIPVVPITGTNYLTDMVLHAPLDWFTAGLIMSTRVWEAQKASAGKMASGNIRMNTSVLYGMAAPTNDTPELRAKIAAKARECIEARPGPAAECMKVTNMPESLAKLHTELDVLVDRWWG